jgi:ankyrin repeat protein
LLERGANINQIDNKGRNLLHHAINMSSATADATFETEQFLIDNGVDINLKDQKDRTPLHYAFVKIQDWKNSNQIDPIETVSSLCGCKGLQIDIPDKWLKTPLHYASQRGASICAMYLVQRGASLESKDIYGNTPLGVGLKYQHYNYGIILIQKGASVHPLTFFEDPDKIKKQWEAEAKAKKALYKTQLKKEAAAVKLS